MVPPLKPQGAQLDTELLIFRLIRVRGQLTGWSWQHVFGKIRHEAHIEISNDRVRQILKSFEAYGFIQRQRTADKAVVMFCPGSRPSLQRLLCLEAFFRLRYVIYCLWLQNDPTLASQRLPMGVKSGADVADWIRTNFLGPINSGAAPTAQVLGTEEVQRLAQNVVMLQSQRDG